MRIILQYLQTVFLCSLTNSVLCSLTLACYMKIYLYFRGYYPFGIWGANELENPVFWAAATGTVLGFILGLLVGIFLSFFGSKNLSNNILISFLVSLSFVFILLILDNLDNFSLSAEVGASFMVLSLLYILPSIITGFLATNIVPMLSNRN
jgi:hypothetical protein